MAWCCYFMARIRLARGVETDKAFGVALVVHLVGAEGGEVFGVEAVRRLLLPAVT